MKHKAGLAQLAEQESSKLKVGGSSPPLGTIISTALLSLALAFPGAAEAKQPQHAEKASAHVSKSTPKKASSSRPQAKPVAKTASKTKVKPEAASSPKKSQKSQGKAKAEALDEERPSKKSKGARGKNGRVAEKRPAPETSVPVEPKRQVVLEKAETPVRTEHGCSGENGTLSAVGQVMKSGSKTFRCQKTWDYNEGKLVGYPAWVELFMPTPGWGAGLKETPRPPADALPVPGAKAKVAPLADKQPPVAEEDEASSSSVQNQLY
jgi:hypothetical protein